jgi:hypothetical protein
VKTRELTGFFSPKFYQQMLKKDNRQWAAGSGKTASGLKLQTISRRGNNPVFA